MTDPGTVRRPGELVRAAVRDALQRRPGRPRPHHASHSGLGQHVLDAAWPGDLSPSGPRR